MKKVIYGILACVIVVGIIITATIGLNVDIVYSKNVEIDAYIGKTADIKDIKQIAKEVFGGEKMIVQKIELFDDMFSISMKDKSDEELNEKVEQFVSKLNEKYSTELKADNDITIVHNPKIRLSSIIKPYILPIAISTVIILVFAGIRYRKLGILKIVISYLGYLLFVEGVYFGLLAITRFPINRFVIPIGLAIMIVIFTTLSFKNEQKLEEKIAEEKKK